ncbi:hypothetical protein [Gelidibacter sp.]|uniref:hypothetical protein n=1 Tax=Gelidibacter sp. TaxID=2018083 RepID=UPI002CA7EA06|nr:hypothetical protein [Gelidibacter sp.]HUH27680.1 hypothetical protein [Gelidibacter sp.]
MFDFLYKIMYAQNCFNIYFRPVSNYIKGALDLAFDNDAFVFYSALCMSFSMQCISHFLDLNIFGVSNLILLLVIITVFTDAGYGVKKSLRIAKEAESKAKLIKDDTPERRALLKTVKLKRFSTEKLQFTFFKCLTLIAYLYFAKTILEVDDNQSVLAEVVGFTTAVVIKIPLAIFWYRDFKSIGKNFEFLYKKKPPIFEIVESIFELKFKKYFNKEKQEA